MLLKKAVLDAIKAGDISLVFRRWLRPSVKTGGTLKTAIGVLSIDSCIPIERSDITEEDARDAGYESRASLLAELDTREGSIYRIQVHYVGKDPRIALREDDDLSEADFEEVQTRLNRLDSCSSCGEWTQKILIAIQSQPHLPAGELAKHTGFDKEWLKVNIRKLKKIGLTISLQIGYELSPRGKAVLEYLKGETKV